MKTRAGLRLATRLLVAIATCLLLSVCSVPHAHAQASTPPSGRQPPSAELRRQWEDYRVAMAQVAPPKKGCFTASFPSREWREIACVPAPDYPMLPRAMAPRGGPVPLTVGDGNDILAVAPSGTISAAIGSFENLSNVTGESGLINNAGSAVADAYTLQINTNFMTNATICAGASVPADCRVWEQFVFENNNTRHRVFIQYWLIRFGNPCPAGQNWISNPIGGVNFCFKNNSLGAAPTTNQPVTNLANMALTGSVTATGDQAIFADGGTLSTVVGDNAVGASGGWTQAEFNIVGDAGSGQANFNAGADMTLRTRIIHGGRQPPTCQAGGTTGETNNLNFGPTAPGQSQPGPAVIFRQSTAGGLMGCAAAVTVGDTHLRTFGGLFYDFQASGDFLLAQSDPEFVVQARQVSGAPTWPDASVNSAVATQMGKDKVAVCLESGLNVNGTNQQIADGANLFTPEGTTIWHQGNVYTVIGAHGDSLRATVNATWIDVDVGLGHWPAQVRGLLANYRDDVQQIASRDGQPIGNPFAFDALYHAVGDSWRVAAKDSLLDVCGGAPAHVGNPSRPFFARDLERATRVRTRAVCVAAGVKGETLLDACTLDVAVLGDDGAKVYVNMLPPVAEARPIFTDDGGGLKKWWWLILVVLALLIVWLLSRRGKA